MNTGYAAGMRDHRVKIFNKVAATSFGDTTSYQCAGIVWASVTWSKGVKSLREGVLDAYDTVMIRMNWTDKVTRDSQLECDGKTYQVQSLNSNKRQNIIQITATEITGKQDYTYSGSEIAGGPKWTREFGT